MWILEIVLNQIKPTNRCCTPVVQQKYILSKTSAVHKFINGDYINAISIAWQLIKNGSDFTISSYIIGYCYENGTELQTDLSLAIKFYLLSAQCGFFLSQLSLGDIYYSKIIENPKFYYNMSYHFYNLFYRNRNTVLYDKLLILYLLAKMRIQMYINLIAIDKTILILKEPLIIKTELINERTDLDDIIKK